MWINTYCNRAGDSRGQIAMVLLALVAATVSGCTGADREQIRDWTYPPDFNYLETSELRSIMTQIAIEVAALNKLLRAENELDAATQRQILQHLQAMDAAAQQLGPGGWPSNHPRISDNAHTFQRDIVLAIRAARKEPPRYFLAGSLSGSCSICHGSH